MIKICIRILKCIFGFGSLEDICWFSENYYCIHDYPIKKGGDGVPTHFHTYVCTSCNKTFTI
jgi:hypothetical protein